MNLPKGWRIEPYTDKAEAGIYLYRPDGQKVCLVTMSSFGTETVEKLMDEMTSPKSVYDTVYESAQISVRKSIDDYVSTSVTETVPRY